MSTPAHEAPIAERYDEVAPGYDQSAHQALAQRLIWQTYDHLTWKPVEQRLPDQGTWHILDAGGGGGKFGVRFAERGHQVTVLDLSPAMLEQARERFTQAGLLERARFVVGDVLALDFPDCTFDLVFCEGDPVSYCLERYPHAMRELVRVARPGAPVVLGVDSRYDHFMGAVQAEDKRQALSILLTGRSTCPYGLPVHAFTLPELHEGMQAAGAEVEEILGKPVLFWELIQAMNAARGPDFRASKAMDEVLAIQEQLSRTLAPCGGHYQVMARRRS